MKIKWLLCVGLQILMFTTAGLQIQPNWKSRRTGGSVCTKLLLERFSDCYTILICSYIKIHYFRIFVAYSYTEQYVFTTGESQYGKDNKNY